MEKGLVIKSTGSWISVKMENGDEINCKIKGKFRTNDIRNTNPVAVGDRVHIINEGDYGIIIKIEPRTNYIIRKSTKLSKETQIIASNIDQLLLVTTIVTPEISTLFLDRILMTAEAYNIPSFLVFNKLDIYKEDEKEKLNEIINVYKTAGYDCYIISAFNGTNLHYIKNLIKGKVSLIAGQSGVGKSTILNAVDPDLNLKTRDVSKSHQTGKHTTTFSEMHLLESGGSVIDTPGIKGFGLVDFKKEEIYHFFPEIFNASRNCRFNNCSHTHEADCAVKKSLETGSVSQMRYNNYISIYRDKEDKYRGQ